MKKIALISKLFIALLLSQMALANDNVSLKDKFGDQINELVNSYHQKNKFDGVLLVAKGNEIIYHQARGLANWEWGIENTVDTKFRIGSLTKQFVAALVLQQVEAGVLSLDDSISQHLNDYRSDTGKKISLHHLLSHTSGIPNSSKLERVEREQVRKLRFEPDDFIAKFCSDDLNFKPGKKFEYSNSNYYILGRILEQVTGLAFSELLQKNILDPLNLENTGVDDGVSILSNRASAYMRKKSDDKFYNALYVDLSTVFTAGNMYSTARDLYQWHQALMSGEVISIDSLVKMTTPVKGSSGYGYGLNIRSVALRGKRRVKHISHFGMIYGYYSSIDSVPGESFFIVMLSNRKPDRKITSLIARRILGIK